MTIAEKTTKQLMNDHQTALLAVLANIHEFLFEVSRELESLTGAIIKRDNVYLSIERLSRLYGEDKIAGSEGQENDGRDRET